MASDKKKCQTLINLCAEAAEQLDNIATQLETYRGLYQAASIDPAGTALEGNVVAVSNWIDSIRADADSAVAQGLIAAKVPSHRNKALD